MGFSMDVAARAARGSLRKLGEGEPEEDVERVLNAWRLAEFDWQSTFDEFILDPVESISGLPRKLFVLGFTALLLGAAEMSAERKAAQLRAQSASDGIMQAQRRRIEAIVAAKAPISSKLKAHVLEVLADEPAERFRGMLVEDVFPTLGQVLESRGQSAMAEDMRRHGLALDAAADRVFGTRESKGSPDHDT